MFDTEVFEQFHRCHANFGIELVNIARNEKRYFHEEIQILFESCSNRPGGSELNDRFGNPS